jgi:hypothetical protein
MSRMVFHLTTKLKHGIKPSLLGRSLFARGFREPVESNVFSANRWRLDRGFFLVAGANGNAPMTRRWKETPHGSSLLLFRSGAVDADRQRLQKPLQLSTCQSSGRGRGDAGGSGAVSAGTSTGASAVGRSGAALTEYENSASFGRGRD